MAWSSIGNITLLSLRWFAFHTGTDPMHGSGITAIVVSLAMQCSRGSRHSNATASDGTSYDVIFPTAFGCFIIIVVDHDNGDYYYPRAATSTDDSIRAGTAGTARTTTTTTFPPRHRSQFQK